MNIETVVELAVVDNTLAHRHIVQGKEGFRALDPHVLAARIRGADSESDEPLDVRLERAAACLYASYCADSMDEARSLLSSYLRLLDAGQRPLMSPLWRPPGGE